MTGWEYRTEKMENPPKGAPWAAHMAEQLNGLGRVGWELVNVAVVDRGTHSDLYAFLKRPTVLSAQ